MKQIQKRMILQVVLGFLIGRTDIFGLNPAGVAYFAAGFTEGGSVFAVALAVFLGMASSSINMEMAVCGGMVMLALGLASDLLKRKGIHIKMGHAAIISALASAVLWLLQLGIMPYNIYNVWLAVLGSIMVIACTRIFHDGLHFLLHSRKYSVPGNEEMASIVIIFALAVWGFPEVIISGISVADIIIYITLLLAGYC